jgi:NAD+ kinase
MKNPSVAVASDRRYPEIKIIEKALDVVPLSDADICISIGGDGTFIRATGKFVGPVLPIRAEKNGSTGYNADIRLKEIGTAVDLLKKGRYSIVKAGRKMELEYKGMKMYAVNEIRLNNIIGKVNFTIALVRGRETELLYPYVMGGDGVIITGRMGSTAYNRSAGGPILLSDDIAAVTFLNVDGPFYNSIVLDRSETVEVKLIKHVGMLKYDDTKVGVLKEGQVFRAKLSDRHINIVKLDAFREGVADKLARMMQSRTRVVK